MTPKYLERPPPGMFVLSVMRQARSSRLGRGWDWAALMIDVDPEEHCSGERQAEHAVWVRIPGKHRDQIAAWNALEDMIATRH
jgi:hypothetical protein